MESWVSTAGTFNSGIEHTESSFGMAGVTGAGATALALCAGVQKSNPAKGGRCDGGRSQVLFGVCGRGANRVEGAA
jgi:hypothetical protein